VLLPAGYDPERRYPLLVLLNGLNSNYAWYAQSGLTASLAGLDAIVVMPEGASGWYTDWWNNGTRGSPSWETYELDDVIPAILARYPILPERQYHAIAGTSMGGLGATYLGGRWPGFFGSVASLSGFTDLGYYSQIVEPGMGLTALAPFHGDDDVDPVDGAPGGFYFDGHDPTQLAANLAHTRVFVTSGTGAPSRANVPLVTDGALPSFLEGVVAESVVIYPMNQRYIGALRAAGVDATYQVQPGGHDNPDFANEIKQMVAWGLFKPVVSDPSSWVNATVATQGQLWDISYSFAQPPNQVVQFHQSGPLLAISSAGSAVTITTSRGCVLHTSTPATVVLPRSACG
jgi:S-formylglutathione hydrolase FrmB